MAPETWMQQRRGNRPQAARSDIQQVRSLAWTFLRRARFAGVFPIFSIYMCFWRHQMRLVRPERAKSRGGAGRAGGADGPSRPKLPARVQWPNRCVRGLKLRRHGVGGVKQPGLFRRRQ